MAEFTPELLATAVKLPPEKAIAYFKGKGFKFGWNWFETLDSAHNKVFTVAKAMRMDILKDIRSELDKGLKNGTTFEQFKKDLKPKLQAKGWWGKKEVMGPNGKQVVQLGSPHRLRTIYNTNVASSYNAGRWKQQFENRDDRGYLMHVDIIDDVTRPMGRALNGTVYPIDDPHWDSWYPPNEFNDRGVVRALTKEQYEVRKGQSVETQKALKKEGLPTAKDFKGPSKGFNNNPGKVQWTPKKADYPADIWDKGEKFETQRPKPSSINTISNIQKTGKLNKNVESKVASIEKTIKNLKTEQGYEIDALTGEINTASVTRRKRSAAVPFKNPDSIVVHNHPLPEVKSAAYRRAVTEINEGNSFSGADLAVGITRNYSQIRAIDPKYTYKLTRRTSTWITESEYKKRFHLEMKAPGEYTVDYERITKYFDKRLAAADKISNNTMRASTAFQKANDFEKAKMNLRRWMDTTNKTWNEISKEFGWKYERVLNAK